MRTPRSRPSLPSWLQLLLFQGWMLHGHPSLDNERQAAQASWREDRGQLCNGGPQQTSPVGSVLSTREEEAACWGFPAFRCSHGMGIPGNSKGHSEGKENSVGHSPTSASWVGSSDTDSNLDRKLRMVLKACGVARSQVGCSRTPRDCQASGRLAIPEPSPGVCLGCALPGPAQTSQGPQ